MVYTKFVWITAASLNWVRDTVYYHNYVHRYYRYFLNYVTCFHTVNSESELIHTASAHADTSVPRSINVYLFSLPILSDGVIVDGVGNSFLFVYHIRCHL